MRRQGLESTYLSICNELNKVLKPWHTTTPLLLYRCGYSQLIINQMYKCFKITKKYRLTFNKFPKTAKSIKSVDAYSTGIRNWVADDSYNYSIVLGTFRIIFSIERTDVGCCQG